MIELQSGMNSFSDVEVIKGLFYDIKENRKK